ncbi:phage tail protein [Pseudomonas putida]|uniref:phage tail protein n=1 Tax=Pseudomonas putida TaxID=303 RepID=UPI001FB69EFC|nr:phage tail protein [Pseudomonas putida]
MVDQTSQFYAILTNAGAAKQANADALGVPWTITHMAVGDGNPSGAENPALPQPSATWTALLNEWRRAPLNQLRVDEKDASIIVAEQVIPADIGGRWIREIGLYDSDGALVAVANCAPTYKPLLSQGSGRTQVVRMSLIVSSSSNVQLKIDPSVVLATREYVDSKTVRASQVEAEEGTENSKIMTPLRVFQAIAKVVKQATETAFGWAKISTQAQVDAGTDDATIVSPKKLRATLVKLGFLTDEAPYISTLLKHTQTGTYIGFGGGNAKATAGVPDLFADTSRNSLLNIEAFRPRVDITVYRVWEATGIEYEGMYSDGASVISWRRISNDGYPASESLTGPAKLATQAQVTTGTDDATIITPKKLRAAQATQAEAEAGTDNTKVMTPLRVFQAIAKVVVQATETAFGWAKIATQAQVTTGTDDTAMVTAKKFRAGLAAFGIGAPGTDIADANLASLTGIYRVPSGLNCPPVPGSYHLIHIERAPGYQSAQIAMVDGGAGSSHWTRNRHSAGTWSDWNQSWTTGNLALATQDQVDAGTNDASFVTPKKLRLGFTASLTTNGYIVFPSWLGGLVIQWGRKAHDATTNAVALSTSFNIAFPNACFFPIVISDAGSTCTDLNAISNTVMGFNITARDSAGTIVAGTYYWFAIGN